MYCRRGKKSSPITDLGAKPVHIMDKQRAECFEFASKFSIIILNHRDLLSCSESFAESFPNELRAEGENMKSPF